MLDVDSSAIPRRGEADLDLGRRLPAGVLPGEDDARWGLAGVHATDLELLAVAESFVEPASDLRFQEDRVSPFAAVREVPTLQRPPPPDPPGDNPKAIATPPISPLHPPTLQAPVP